MWTYLDLHSHKINASFKIPSIQSLSIILIWSILLKSRSFLPFQIVRRLWRRWFYATTVPIRILGHYSHPILVFPGDSIKWAHWRCRLALSPLLLVDAFSLNHLLAHVLLLLTLCAALDALRFWFDLDGWQLVFRVEGASGCHSDSLSLLLDAGALGIIVWRACRKESIGLMWCANLEHRLNISLLCRLIQDCTLFDIPLDCAAHISTFNRCILLDSVTSLAHHISLIPSAISNAITFSLSSNSLTSLGVV